MDNFKGLKQYVMESLSESVEQKNKMENYTVTAGIPESEGDNKYPIVVSMKDSNEEYKGVYDADEDELTFKDKDYLPDDELLNELTKMAKESVNDLD